MTLIKHMLLAGAFYTLATLALPTIGFAQGGDDPMPGIDIIIKIDPSGDPIRHVSLSSGEIKQLNKLKGKARPNYLAKIVAPRLAKLSQGSEPPINWTKTLQQGIGKHWCGPCKMVTSFSVVAKTKEPKTAYKATFKIHFGERHSKK